MLTALGVWNLHHWTPGEVPSYRFLHMVVGICQSQSPNLSRHHFPSGNHKFTTFSYPLRVQMKLSRRTGLSQVSYRTEKSTASQWHKRPQTNTWLRAGHQHTSFLNLPKVSWSLPVFLNIFNEYGYGLPNKLVLNIFGEYILLSGILSSICLKLNIMGAVWLSYDDILMKNIFLNILSRVLNTIKTSWINFGLRVFKKNKFNEYHHWAFKLA